MGRSLFAGFLSIFGAKMTTSVVSIVSLPVIVRVLGPAGYGDYAFLLSTLTLLLVVVSSGVTEGVQKFAAENRDREGWTADVVGFYARLAAVLAMAGAVGLAAVVETGAVTRFFGDYRLEFYLLALLLVLIQFKQLARRVLLAFELERYSESLRVVNKLLTVGLGLGLAISGLGVVGMLLGMAVGNATVALVGAALVVRRVPLASVVRVPDGSFPRRQLLTFNAMNVALVLLTMSLYHVDVLMLRTLVGSEATGYYKAALAIAEYLWFVPISLEALLLHSTSSLWSDGALDRITDLSARISRYTVLFVGLLAVGIAALAERFVPLYFGADYVPMVGPLLWLLPGTVGFAVARPILAISRANGDLRPVIVATGAAAAINLGLNAALIPRYGIAGAAAATSVGYASMLAFHTVSARRLGFDPMAGLRPLRMAATCAVTAAVVFPLAATLQGDLVALAVVPPVGLCVHVAVALATGAVDRGEAEQLLSSVPLPLPTAS